jgi:hypothetical protein
MIKEYKSFDKILYQDLKLKKIIPTTDTMAIKLNPKYKKFYNKKYLCEIQNINHGFNVPIKFPTVIKPYLNLHGGSLGFRIIKNKNNFKLQQGEFWMELLTGEHLCIDLFILHGEIKLYTILRSKADHGGTFKYHESMPNYKLDIKIKNFIKKYFYQYTGIINCETISNLIIDFHLRPNGDFYLYNDDVIEQIVNLYFYKKWELKKYKVPKMFLFPVFVKNSKKFEINLKKVVEILTKFNCDNFMYQYNLNSPGGTRIFMYSSSNFQDGNRAKNEILKSIKYYNFKKKYFLILFLFIVLLIMNINGKINKSN